MLEVKGCKLAIGILGDVLALSLLCLLQFSTFRSKEKSEKKYNKHRLGEVDEGHESSESDQPSRVETMSAADFDSYFEQMLVSGIS